HIDGIVGRVLIHRRAVIHRIGRIVDIIDRDIDGGRVGVARIARAVVTDGVSETVTSEVVRRWRVAYAGGGKGDAAVRTLGNGDDRQTSVDWRCQIIGVSVV